MLSQHGIPALKTLAPGSVMSIGNFDGMHLGHQHILQTARSLCTAGQSIVLVTFEPHPLTVLKPALAPPRLTSESRKHQLARDLGVDVLVTLAPTPDVLSLTAEDFFSILRDDARVSHLVEGKNFNFGKARGGNVDKLRIWCDAADIGFTVVTDVEVTLTDLSLVGVSSSLTRWLAGWGRVRDAGRCLGRPFEIEGKVVRGQQRGRLLGYPTANLDCAQHLVPRAGVYSCRAHIDGRWVAGALSIGTKPTFNHTEMTVEAHLLDFAGDLYDRTLRLELLDFVRDQSKFPGVEALRAQLARDVECVRRASPAKI
jgi:riboflavin kinase / FMN adenylyltransferase